MKKFMACALSTCMVAATLVACDNGTTTTTTTTTTEPATPTDGTYGDWAITESPIGFFWGGTWVVSSQAAVDAGKAEGVKAIMEYITLDDSENIGRKLDFLTQELNREANTVLSKSTDVTIANFGIELKTLIEKIREQIQNIE